MTKETIAIIDLGTNTFHLMLAEIDEREDYVIKGKFKEPVQLGEGGINAGKIADEAFKRGIRALKTFRTLLDTSGIVRVFAFATSAIRSASNGPEFIKAAMEEANIHIKTINGNEEASIIYEGVKHGVQLPFNEHVLLIDIGGGSVEFIVAHEGRAELLRSLNIGGARLLDRIKPSNPITPKEISAVYKLFDAELSQLINELKEFPLTMLVGSSGTCETLGTLAAIAKKDKISTLNINGYSFSRSDFEEIYARLLVSNKAERIRMEGMEPLRAEMIVLGACLVNYVLRELALENIMISSHALKEGIMHRYIRDKKVRISKYMGATDKSLRAKSVQSLAQKYRYEQEHVLMVSELATMLFEQLQPLHGFGIVELELLQYACILHDIGKFIHVSGHHKHTQYIIANSNISGFNTTELLVISNIARYHRKTGPKAEHPHFAVLSAKDKRIVQVLSGILRIADNLDRGHRHFIHNIKVNISSDKIQIQAFSTLDVEMEITYAQEVADVMEVAFGKKIDIKWIKG